MPHEYQNTGVSLDPDTGVSSTDLLTNENTPTFQGTAAAGSTVEVFADGTSIGSSGPTTSGSWSVKPRSPLANGEHVITYEVTDSDGTTTPSTDSLTITIDTVDPGFTDGAAVTRTTEENIGSDQIIHTANATDNLSGVTYRLKDGLADDAQLFTIFSKNGDVALNENPDHETQDVYNFTVVATDDAGNESEQAVTLNVTDQSIPKPSLISTQDPEQDGITNSSTPTFQGKAEPNSSVQVFIGEGESQTALGTTTADSSGNWILTPSDYSGSPFSTDGDYSITYEFTKDGAVSDRSDPLTVTIDTASPSFNEGATVTRTIEENSGSNQVVYEAKTTDDTEITYRLKTGLSDDAGEFTIDSSTGEVSLNHNPDHEFQNSYSFTVVATDAAGNPSTEQAVTLNVINQDFAAPNLLKPEGGIDLDGVSNSPTPTFAGQTEAGSTVEVFIREDEDTYTRLGTTTADANGNWQLTSSSWELSPETTFASEGDYTITYRFTPVGGTSSDHSAPLPLKIDKTAPSITSADRAPTIEEDSGADQVVYDSNSSDESTVSYSLRTDLNDDADSFEIDSSNGEVTLLDDPNHETQAQYQFTVVATDAAGNWSDKTVSLSIADKVGLAYAFDGSLTNTQTPTFEGSAEPNTSVSLYKIVDGDPEGTFIGSTNTYANGIWTFKVPAGYLSEGSNTIKVTSTPDGDVAQTSSELTITVDSTAPSITSGDPGNIDENSGTNQTVYTVASTDNSAVSYSIKQGLNDDADHFKIISNSGQVSLIESPDFEEQQYYRLTVVATDAADNSSEKSLILNVNDLHTGHANLLAADNTVIQGSDLKTNNNTPTIRISAPQYSEVEIFDGEKSLGTFTAQGSGEGAHWSTFTLPELDDGVHQIYHQYTPAGGVEGTTSDQPVTPLTLTIDTGAPLITSPSIVDPIDEKSGAGQVVYTATSSDPGATYSLSGPDSSYFEILAGVVTLKDDPVYASKPAYHFTVDAHDAAGNITSKELTLDVVDKTAPVIDSGDPGNINENSGINQVVYTPTSQDASAVSYSIKQDVYDFDEFAIDTIDGVEVVRLIESPNFEDQEYYRFTVVATDAADNFSEKDLILNVNDLHTGHANLLASDGSVIQGSDLSTNNNTPTIRISAPQFSEVEIFDGEKSLGTFTAQGSAEGAGLSTFTLPELDDGVHQIYHQYTPPGGVEGTTSDQPVNPLTLTIDTDSPPIIAPVNKSIHLSPHEIAWDDGIGIQANPPLDLSGELTIAFWLNRDASPTIQSLQGIFQSYSLNIKTDGTLEWSRSGSGSASTDLFSVQGSTSIPVNQWTHISAVMRETGPGTYNAELWVNGQLDGSSSSTEGIQNTQNNDLSIMTAGKFDNIQVWNTALAQSELPLVANNQGFDISRDSLIAEYTFENDTLGSISSINDSSGKGNHGFLVDENSGTILQEPFSQGPRSSDQNVVEAPSAISIDENSGSGQVVYTAASSDLSATYSLSGPDSSYFEILAGVVTLKDDPVYASRPSYNFTVNAHDAAGNITSKELTLDVVDKTAPVIDSGTIENIDENSGTNQVVYTVASTDASVVGYSIKQDLADDADHFSINSSTGEVSLIESPDFEDQEYYRFTVVATDAAGNFSEKGLILNVNDGHTGHANLLANDNSVIQGSDLATNNNTPTIRISAPQFSEVEIFDGEKSLGTFTAQGSGEGAHWSTFTLPELDDGVHQIYHQYTPAGGREGTTSDQPVTPLTLTIDTTAPSITSPSTATAIDENSGAGQVVYTATSSDPGATYSLSGADASDFIIIDGVVTLTDNPDFETKNAYAFTLQATDANNNISDQVVSLSINDVKPVKPSLLDVNNDVVDDGYTTSAAPKLSGLAEINSSVQLFIDGVEVNPSSTPINYDSITGAWSVDLVNPVSMSGDNLIPSDGAYSVSVKATPVGGTHVEESDALVLTVDEVPDPVRALWSEGDYIIDVLGRKDIGPSDSAITLTDPSGRLLSDALSGAWNGIRVMQSDDTNVGYYRMLQVGERGRRQGHYRITELSIDGVVQSWGTWVTPTQAVADGYQELFDIDLNGDGQTSVPSFDANGDGFVDGLGHYVLTDGTSQVNLTDYRGRIFSTGSSTRWKALQAQKTADGFDILIQGTGRRTSSRYQVLTTNHDGDLLTNTRWTEGDVLMRQGFETYFDKDLNGDNVIGAPPVLDRDANGLVDGVTNYAVIKQGVDSAPDTYVELTNSRGRFLSDSSSRAWNVIHAAEDGSEFKILAQGERGRRRSLYQLWTADSTGVVTDTSRWLSGNQLALDGYETLFALDFNNNGSIGT